MNKILIVILILIAHTTLLANTLTEKEISEWKSIGVEKMFIGNWKSQGIKTPRDAKRWIDAGETRVSISQWKNIKITDPDEVVKWKKTKLSFTNIQKALKEKITPEILEKWYKEGILYEETIFYFTRKITNLEEAKKLKSYNIKNEQDFESLSRSNINYSELEKWMNIGLSPSEIAKWKYYNVNNPEDVQKWINIGITLKNISQIQSWKQIGLNDVEEIKKWKSINFSPDNVKHYTNKGFSYEAISSWLEVGVLPKEIEKFISFGIKTAEEAKIWTTNGVYSVDTINYAKDELNINNPAELKEWFDLGFSTTKIKEWKNLGINTPSEAKEWKKVEDEENINRWLKAGVNDPEEVKMWKSNKITHLEINLIKEGNLTIEKIRKWREQDNYPIYMIVNLEKGGFKEPEEYLPYKNMNYEHAIKLKEWGNIKPDKLIRSMSIANKIIGKEFYFKDKETFISSYEILNGVCEEIVDKQFFVEIDMSQNKNRCFVFTGTMLQRLDDKNVFGKITQKGIVNSYQDRAFYAEKFNGEWLENTLKAGVIKGNGSYKYESNFGTRVIPQGEVLLLR